MGHLDGNGNADGKAGPVTMAALQELAVAKQRIAKRNDDIEFQQGHDRGDGPTDKQAELTQVMNDAIAKAPVLNNAEDQHKAQAEAGKDAIMSVCQGESDLDAMAAALKTMDPKSPQADAMAAAMFEVMQHIDLDALKQKGDNARLIQLEDYAKQIQTMRTPTMTEVPNQTPFLNWFQHTVMVDQTDDALKKFEEQTWN